MCRREFGIFLEWDWVGVSARVIWIGEWGGQYSALKFSTASNDFLRFLFTLTSPFRGFIANTENENNFECFHKKGYSEINPIKTVTPG